MMRSDSSSRLDPRNITAKKNNGDTAGDQGARGRLSRKIDQELACDQGARGKLYRILSHEHFQTVLGSLIALNFLVIIIEVNESAACVREPMDQPCTPPWLSGVNVAYHCVYTAEAAVRVYVFRLNYFKNAWDVFDFIIVLTGNIEIILVLFLEAVVPSMQMLRMFRVAKLMRVPRVMRLFPELHAMIRGFYSAMSAMMWGCVLILLILLMWAVLAVEILNPINISFYEDENEFCASTFSSVFSAMLTFFQTLIAGDAWGECSIALIQHAPVSFVIFAGSLMSIQLGFTNLILAVVVERSSEVQEQEKHSRMMERYNRRQDAETDLKWLCQEIDLDQDGRITSEELLQSYDEHEEVRSCFETLDIDRGELEYLFQLMDIDDAGELTYEDLIVCIHKSDHSDVNRELMLVKLQMEDVWVRVREHLQESVDVIIRKLEANYPKSPQSQRASTRRKLRRSFLKSRSFVPGSSERCTEVGRRTTVLPSLIRRATSLHETEQCLDMQSKVEHKLIDNKATPEMNAELPGTLDEPWTGSEN